MQQISARRVRVQVSDDSVIRPHQNGDSAISGKAAQHAEGFRERKIKVAESMAFFRYQSEGHPYSEAMRLAHEEVKAQRL